MKKLICKIFGHKKPRYKRVGTFMRCKRCGDIIGLVGNLYGVSFVDENEKRKERR